MKNIIIALFILFACAAVSWSNAPFNTAPVSPMFTNPAQVYTFTTGDTATTFSFRNAKMCMFTIRDSSMAGTDSIGIWLKHVYNGISFYSAVSLIAQSQTTYTTLVSSALFSPGDNTTVTYTWYPCGKIMGCDATWTGTFYVARLNQPPTAAGYQPKTRIIFEYD